MTLLVRDAVLDDVDLLWHLLTHAASMPTAGTAAAIDEVVNRVGGRSFVMRLDL